MAEVVSFTFLSFIPPPLSHWAPAAYFFMPKPRQRPRPTCATAPTFSIVRDGATSPTSPIVHDGAISSNLSNRARRHQSCATALFSHASSILSTLLFHPETVSSRTSVDPSTQVASAPAGLQACSFDIKSFHRTCPALPAHKPFLVVSYDGGFFSDHCYPFGAASASSNAGQICNAMVNIWKAEMGNDPLPLKYEDDLSVFRFPNTAGPFTCGSSLYRFDCASIIVPIVEVEAVVAPWW